MKKRLALTQVALLLSTLGPALCGHAQAPAQAPAAPRAILEIKGGMEKLLAPSSAQVTVARSTDAAAPGLIVTIQPGPDPYPGVALKPAEPWDLSNFGHVEARVANLGAQPLALTLRVDGVGPWQDNPWNAANAAIEPGKTDSAKAIFGYSWGKPGFALKPQAVTQILLFAAKSDAVQSFRIESLLAAGPAGEKLPVDPASQRIQPRGGVLLGAGVLLDAAQLSAAHAAASLAAANGQQSLRLALPAGTGEASMTLKPPTGRWDLRDALQVLVRVRNESPAPITARARVESNGGASDWAASAALAPGAESEIAVPFASAAPKNLGQKETLARFTSDAVSGITVAADKAAGAGVLTVRSIRAVMPPAPPLPDWLGKRPPVEGDWAKTLDDEFDGEALDASLWSVAGPNYWDKTSHWSRDNVLLGGGVVRLRYEKKTGFHDDDAALKPSDYASGYLHSFGRWAQRYGYFEARMKLPKSPGLWPAFWMMPDRGAQGAQGAGPGADQGADQGRRQDTANGGMEFDILEHLTRWGGTRYNITMHWDGYGPEHKSIGSDSIYVAPDKDGFITAGLLWTPGSAIYYANGREVLRWENPRISSVPEMLMFTLPMGGWDNSPLDDARLPDDFTIDYVRVWQRRDLASPTDGKQPAAPK